MLTALPPELQALIAEAAKGVRETEHKGTRYRVDDYGNCHIRGEYGNADRQAFEYTKAEVLALRGDLRKAGWLMPFDATEGLLLEALETFDRAQHEYRDDREPPSNATRQQRFQAKRPAGICARCPRYRMVEALPDRTLCADCMANETARVAAWRKAKREKKRTRELLTR